MVTMTDLGARIDEAVESHKEEYIALLADLVRCPSLLGNELPAQERLLAHVLSMGLDAELWDLDPASLKQDPRFVDTGRDYVNRPNLSAVLHPKSHGGQSLVLNGHIDVVSPEPISWWKHDPWGAEIENGRLYGRGAGDMKCGLVEALLAIQAVQTAGVTLRGPVIFESVIEEECTGNGMLASRLRTGPVDGAVITEPFGLKAGIAITGTMWVGVTVKGRPAYVGNAGAYVNAVEKAAYLISRVGGIADKINHTFSHPAFSELDRPFTIGVGTIEGGDWPSIVPLVCRFTCRLSYPPGVPPSKIQDLVEGYILAVADDDPWLSSHPPLFDYPGFFSEGWAIEADAPLVTALANCHHQVSGKELEKIALRGTSDARYLKAELGEQGVYYGPVGGNGHMPDEYVELDSIVAAAKVLARLIVEWCG